jgi:hypothetical protein
VNDHDIPPSFVTYIEPPKLPMKIIAESNADNAWGINE